MEIQAINLANEPELVAAWDALEHITANQFLDSADALGVAVWERELGFLPRDTDSLAERKKRIKAQWNIKLPYSFRWMQNWLTGLYGQDGHEEAIENYVLTVQLLYDLFADSNGQTAEVLETLRATIPANTLIRGTNKYRPVVLENQRAFWFSALYISLRERFKGQLALERMLLAARVTQPQRNILWLRLRGTATTSFDGSLESVLFHMRANNFGQEIIRLDGRRRLNGSWLLKQGMIRGPELSSVKVTMGAQNRLSASTAVTADTMWRLDGTYRLDGKKKLNAKIVRSEL